MVAIGELGLSGELRRVRDVGSPSGRGRADGLPVGPGTRRVAPRASATAAILDGMRVVDVDNIARALNLLGLRKGGGARVELS